MSPTCLDHGHLDDFACPCDGFLGHRFERLFGFAKRFFVHRRASHAIPLLEV